MARKKDAIETLIPFLLQGAKDIMIIPRVLFLLSSQYNRKLNKNYFYKKAKNQGAIHFVFQND